MPIKVLSNFQGKHKRLTHLLLTVLLGIVFLLPINEIYAWHTRSARIKIINPISSVRIVVTLTPKPTRTKTPTKTPTPTVRLTRTPTPPKVPTTPSPTINKTSSIPTTSTITSSKQDFIMQKINDFRRSQGKSEVKTDSNTCTFAETRAEEISKNFNHDGFRSRIDSKTLPYSGYSSVTENIAMNSDYTKIVDMWINSSGHAENMRKDTPYVCVESFGNYYAYEGWRP